MINKTITKTSVYYFQILLTVLSYFIPFLVAGPQWLTGSLVNAFLILSTTTSSKKNLLIISILPSLGALSHGVVFGPLTPFLVYFLPFIWLGNLTLISVFIKLNKTIASPITLLIGSLMKATLLYFSALIFFQLKIVPKIFITSMGMIQFITALTGGILALVIFKFINIKLINK